MILFHDCKTTGLILDALQKQRWVISRLVLLTFALNVISITEFFYFEVKSLESHDLGLQTSGASTQCRAVLEA